MDAISAACLSPFVIGRPLAYEKSRDETRICEKTRWFVVSLCAREKHVAFKSPLTTMYASPIVSTLYTS